MIVDAHTHIYPADRQGFWRRPSGAAELVRAMDDAGVGRAAVLAIAPAIPTEVVAAEVATDPDRLFLVGSVDPRSAAALAEVDDAVRRSGARAIKIHPRLQKLGLDDLDQIAAVARRCESHDVPLVICSFLGGRTLLRSRTLELCERLADACPGTRLVLAHAGGYRPLDALLLLKAHGNIHVDLSFSPVYFRGSSVETDLGFLLKKADPARVLFGSDFPEVSMRDSVEWVSGAMARLGLTPSARNAILFGNALRLFGLSTAGGPA